jgi:TusA-related sulfurtransferase
MMVKEVELERIDQNYYSLDVRGHVCPYPELLTVRALQRLSPGTTLEVIIDSSPSVRDIPITLEKRGFQQLKIIKERKGMWKLIVQISE